MQNSDDAQSKAVEIHFETQEYMNRKNGTHTSVGVEENREQLPDLRTALVYVHYPSMYFGTLTGPAGAQLGIQEQRNFV